jgi:hypothetical protein
LPEITGLEWVWEAFIDLSTCRPPAFEGINPVPWTVVKEWATLNDLDNFDFDMLWFCIKKLDLITIEWAKKKSKGK